MSRGRYALLAAMLGLLPMLLPLSVDASVPLVPAVAAYFATGTASVQFSLSAVVLGIAIGQLVYGPLSDRFGRKPVILGGICAYVVVAVACANAVSIEALIALRFLQGFFACSGVIVARAVIRDLFDREAGARLFALMMGIHGIMPTIAPGVSGWLTGSYGWQAVFWAMAGFAAFTGLAILFGLAETNAGSDKRSLHPKTVVTNYRQVLRERSFLCYAVCGSFMYGALMAYFAGAPVGLIQYLGLSPLQFGIAMAVPMVGYIGAQIAVARIAHRVGINGLIHTGAVMAAIAGIGMLAFVVSGNITVYTLMGPVVLLLVSLSFIVPGTTAGAMSPFAHMAGAASSLLGFIQFLAAAAATTAIGLLNDGTPLPMAAMICGCTLSTLLLYLILIRPLRRAAADAG
ncbi:MAG: multidrug effflux MFS transporter [Alphaproteobacteria bacterium]